MGEGDGIGKQDFANLNINKMNMAKTQGNNSRKEAERLLKDKVENLPLDTEQRLYFISGNVEKELKKKDARITKLVEAIDSKFKKNTPERGLYEGFASMSLDTAYALYLQGNNAALVVELQGLLERFCINALKDILPIDDIAKRIVTEMLEKRTLKDVAPYMEKLGRWNGDECKFALNLTDLRNGIAHKNAEIVSRSSLVKANGQDRHYESIHSMMKKVDGSDFIVRTMDLIIKCSGIASPSFIKQPRLYSRYFWYTSIAGELYNLFLTNPYGKEHDPRLEAYINERFAKIYIIGSEELVEKLEVYRKDLLLFHKALDENDVERAREVYERFKETLNDIKLAMRKDLNVDFAGKEMIEDKQLIDIKPFLKKK